MRKVKTKWTLEKPFLIDEKDDRYEAYNKELKATGISPDELWALDSVILEFIVPRLKEFKKRTIGTPPEYTLDEWKEILNKIIKGFEIYIKEESLPHDKKKYKKVMKAKKLFCDHLFCLWS
jgi:hypothetical protein